MIPKIDERKLSALLENEHIGQSANIQYVEIIVKLSQKLRTLYSD